MQITKHLWFPEKVYNVQINENVCDEIIQLVEKDKITWKKNLKNVQALTSGWNGTRYPIIKSLSDHITKDILPEIGKDQSWKFNNWQTDDAWINFYQEKDEAFAHNHQGCHYCAVLIVKPSNGNLVFCHRGLIEKDNTSFKNYELQEINEKKGSLILFPQNMYHYVSACTSERITVAFNFVNNSLED